MFHLGCREIELARGLLLSAASSVILTGGEMCDQQGSFILYVWWFENGPPLPPVFHFVLFSWGNGGERRALWSHCWNAHGHQFAHSTILGKPCLPAIHLGGHHVTQRKEASLIERNPSGEARCLLLLSISLLKWD